MGSAVEHVRIQLAPCVWILGDVIRSYVLISCHIMRDPFSQIRSTLLFSAGLDHKNKGHTPHSSRLLFELLTYEVVNNT